MIKKLRSKIKRLWQKEVKGVGGSEGSRIKRIKGRSEREKVRPGLHRLSVCISFPNHVVVKTFFISFLNHVITETFLSPLFLNMWLLKLFYYLFFLNCLIVPHRIAP